MGKRHSAWRSPVFFCLSIPWGGTECPLSQLTKCPNICVLFLLREAHERPSWGAGHAGTLCLQFSSVTQSCPTLCDPMNRSTQGLPVQHHLPEFTQTQVHQVGDAIQPSHPLSSPFPPAPNPSQHQSLFQWVNSSHEVAKELEFQL